MIRTSKTGVRTPLMSAIGTGGAWTPGLWGARQNARSNQKNAKTAPEETPHELTHSSGH